MLVLIMKSVMQLILITLEQMVLVFLPGSRLLVVQIAPETGDVAEYGMALDDHIVLEDDTQIEHERFVSWNKDSFRRPNLCNKINLH